MIKIRSYQEADASILWNICYHTIRTVNIHDYSQAQVEAWAPDKIDKLKWLHSMNEINPFIAVKDNVIVGFTDLQSCGLIKYFFCHADHQRSGVGKALMDHVFIIGKHRNVKRYYSEVSITARPFYEYFGFNVVSTQEVVVKNQKLQNFLMEKRR